MRWGDKRRMAIQNRDIREEIALSGGGAENSAQEESLVGECLFPFVDERLKKAIEPSGPNQSRALLILPHSRSDGRLETRVRRSSRARDRSKLRDPQCAK